MRHYNEERLHAGLGYLTPAEYYRVQPAPLRAGRQAKLWPGDSGGEPSVKTPLKDAV